MKNPTSIELYMLPMRKLNISTRQIDEPVPIHMHNFYEIELVLDGHGTNWINGTSAPLSRGLLYLLSPNDTHRIDSIGPLYLIHTTFLPDVENGLAVPLPDRGYVAHLSEREMQDVLRYFSMAEAEYCSSDAYRLQAAYATISLVLIHLLRHGRPCAAASTSQRLQPALMYIWQHCSDPMLDLTSVAEACNLSASYFSFIFHKTFGSSYCAYLTECRLRCACYLLNEGDISVTDIAYQSGFSSLSHFFRVFKSRFLCTPGEYRQKHAHDALQGFEDYVPISLWQHGEHTINAKVDTD